MSPTFDLLQSPWIPCIQNDGTPAELGMRDTLIRAHELRELLSLIHISEPTRPY